MKYIIIPNIFMIISSPFSSKSSFTIITTIRLYTVFYTSFPSISTPTQGAYFVIFLFIVINYMKSNYMLQGWNGESRPVFLVLSRHSYRSKSCAL
jgi:hypothetical protein